MKVKKKQQLEAHGWHVGSVDEFLGLNAAEAAYIDLRLTMAWEGACETRKDRCAALVSTHHGGLIEAHQVAGSHRGA